MGSITFNGLATGLDTSALIDSLMEIERIPLDRLEAEKKYLNSRLEAFSSFDSILNELLDAVKDLDTSNELRSYIATPASEDYFSATASSSAIAGSYQIEVKGLAVQEKEVAAGVADADTTTYSGTITLSLDSISASGEPPTYSGSPTPTDITIAAGSTLADIALAINDSVAGVSATIINDGSGSTPYRLVITADNAGDSVTVSGTGDLDQTTGAILFTQAQAGSEAHILVDGGVDIYNSSNTFTNMLPGVTLTLNKANTVGESTNLSVNVDTDGVKTKIETLMAKYNEIITFISEQDDASWGRDQGLLSTKRRLRNLLVTKIEGTGSFNYLTELGLSTDQKTGRLSIDSSTLTAAIENDLESVEKLLVGESGVEGIASKFSTYLGGITDSIDGLLASRKSATDNSIRRIDNNISIMEARLERRESTLRAQFEALEKLVSVMNAQGDYLSQQLSSLNLYGKK
jgi:flagellar hook-associated protein 2